MASTYTTLPAVSWRQPIATASLLPADGNQNGDAIVTQDTDIVYIWNGSTWMAVTNGGTPGTVTSITASSPLASSGGTTPNISVASSTGTGAIVLADSAALTGVPTAPTAAPATSTTQLATTAFVQSQGFIGSSSAMPSANASSTSVVTSATTTYVTAISTTITTTAASAPVYAKATATFTVTGAVPTVAKVRVSINGVAGQEQLLSLTALTTNYTVAVQYISANLGPGTYNVLFEIARNSGTGTVSFFEGTLDAIGLQGSNSNGITQLTGALQAGPGSGSQALTGVLPVANGGTHLSSTTINQLLYSSANNVIAGLSTANTGALVTSSTGVPSIASGTTANRVLRTNGTTVSFAQVAAATDISGTLAAANGGTGHGNWANQQVPFGSGTSLVGDPNLIYDSTNGRFIVGGSGTARINAIVSAGASPSNVALQAYSEGTNNCLQIRNNNAYAIAVLTANNTAAAGSLMGFGRSRGTQSARLQSLNGDTVLNFVGSGYTGSADTGDTGGYNNSLTFIQTENATAIANGGEMFFSTTPNGTRTPVERVRIKQSGESVFSYAIATAQYTTAAKNALTPSPGWVVYDTDLNKLSYYNGTSWVNL